MPFSAPCRPRATCCIFPLRILSVAKKSRLKKIIGSNAAPKRLTLAHEWPRMDRGGLEKIEQWLQQHSEARLVIIDTWARFKPARVSRAGADNYDLDVA